MIPLSTNNTTKQKATPMSGTLSTPTLQKVSHVTETVEYLNGTALTEVNVDGTISTRYMTPNGTEVVHVVSTLEDPNTVAGWYAYDTEYDMDVEVPEMTHHDILERMLPYLPSVNVVTLAKMLNDVAYDSYDFSIWNEVNWFGVKAGRLTEEGKVNLLSRSGNVLSVDKNVSFVYKWVKRTKTYDWKEHSKHNVPTPKDSKIRIRVNSANS